MQPGRCPLLQCFPFMIVELLSMLSEMRELVSRCIVAAIESPRSEPWIAGENRAVFPLSGKIILGVFWSTQLWFARRLSV